MKVRSSFNDQYMEFRGKDPASVRPPAAFLFLGSKWTPGNKPKTSHPTPKTSPQLPRRHFTLCTAKGFLSNHFPLNYRCGMAKLSSSYILKVITDTNACPSCTHAHDPAFKCKLTFFSGASDRSIPLVENIPMGAFNLGIQYETGCQLSLISQSALQDLPTSMYSQGTSSRVRVMTYAGEGKIILTTEVKLKLYGKMLRLSAIEEDLNNGYGFSFPTPLKWRMLTGTSTLSHSSQISILLGGDNHLFFPTEIECDLKKWLCTRAT